MPTFRPQAGHLEHVDDAERRATAILSDALCRGGPEIAQNGRKWPMRTETRLAPETAVAGRTRRLPGEFGERSEAVLRFGVAPGRTTGCNLINLRRLDPQYVFQSSPGRKTGCNCPSGAIFALSDTR